MRSFMVVVGILAALMGTTVRNVHGQGNSRAAENFVLSGVISFDGGGGFAWLQEPTLTNNQVRAVRRGESVGAYRLTEIFEDRVELEGPAGKIFVPLYSAQAASAQAAPGPQTAAAPAPTPPAVANLQQLLRQAAQQPAAAPTTPSPAAADLQELLNQSSQEPTVQGQHPQASAGQATVPQPSTPAMSAPNIFTNAPSVLHQPGSPRQQGLGALLEALGQR